MRRRQSVIQCEVNEMAPVMISIQEISIEIQRNETHQSALYHVVRNACGESENKHNSLN
jgi:hypothetical protein